MVTKIEAYPIYHLTDIFRPQLPIFLIVLIEIYQKTKKKGEEQGCVALIVNPLRWYVNLFIFNLKEKKY